MTYVDEVLQRWVSIEGLPSAFAAARDGVDALLRDRGLRRTSPADTAEALLRGAAASATLEGSISSLDDLRCGRGDETAMTAARVNAELLALVPVLARSPLQVFARLHALAAPLEPSRGRPRDQEGVAVELHSLGTALLDYPATPAAVLAALGHAEIMRIMPFASGNGLVARAVERLVLVGRGVDPASVLVPEAGHLAAGRQPYESALAAYALETRDGIARWLNHAAAALTAAAGASPLADPPP